MTGKNAKRKSKGESGKKPTNSLLPPESKQRVMHINLTIPATALRAIDLGGKFKGKVQVEITGPTSSRLTKIAHLSQIKDTKTKYVISPEVKWLIQEWNRRVEPKPYKVGDRNREFDQRKLNNCKKEMEAVTGNFDRTHLTDWLNHYFEACALDKHIWKDIDHRYKTLSGWVKAVWKARKDSARCWWEPSTALGARERGSAREYVREIDDYPETTKMVADSFAQLVLNTTEYGPQDAEWLRFQKIADRVERAMERKDMNMTKGVFIKVVIRCGENYVQGFDSKTLYPSHLASNKFWKIVLPQYLEDHMPGVTLPSLDLG